MNQSPNQQPEPMSDHLNQQQEQYEETLNLIRGLLFRGENVEICDKLSWLYNNSGMMQGAVEQIALAIHVDVAAMEKHGICYGLNSSTNKP
jgi:hypothetical protein